MKPTIECEREVDGRCLAEVPQFPGALCYGRTSSEASAKAEVLARCILAERLAYGAGRPAGVGTAGAVPAAKPSR